MSKKHTFILSHPNTEWWQFRNGDQQVSTCENDAAMLTSEERFQNTPLLHKLVRPAFTAMLRFVICTMCWHSFRKDNKYKNATNQGVNYRKGLQGYFCGREGELIWATEPLIRMAWMNSSKRLMMWGWQRVVGSLLWPQIVFVCACMCACILSFFCLLVCVPATTLCPIGTTSSSITTKNGYEATACLNILLFHFSIFPSLSLSLFPLTLLSCPLPLPLFSSLTLFSPSCSLCLGRLFSRFACVPAVARFHRSRALPDARVEVRISVSTTPQMGQPDCRQTAGLTDHTPLRANSQEIGCWTHNLCCLACPIWI